MRRMVSSSLANSGFRSVRRWLRQPPDYPGHLQWRRRFQSAGLVSGAMLLVLAASEPAAHAQRFEFDYTGSLVTFTVPIKGTYQIIAFGGQGGGSGGRGAEIGGDFTLMQDETLRIAVGGAGGPGGNPNSSLHGAGGGGGTFVVGPDTPLVIAGGGGGNGTGDVGGGGPGLAGPDGGGGAICLLPGVCDAMGGTGGGGGSGSVGGGGGGFISAGGNGSSGVTGGDAFPDLTGGTVGGGFGGGGGGSFGAGGGGGYSGGGGGSIFTHPFFQSFGGGGGGSFDAGTDQILVAGVWTGNGKVVINLVSPVFAGTPGKANCHGQSVSALARQFGGLNNAAAALGYLSVDALQAAILEFCED